VHTQVVNKHGGLIGTTHHLAMGTEALVENRAMSVVAKARVVWLGEKDDARDLHPVGLELLKAQNVWGITFPPDDWRPESEEETPPAPNPLPTEESLHSTRPRTPLVRARLLICARLRPVVSRSRPGRLRPADPSAVVPASALL